VVEDLRRFKYVAAVHLSAQDCHKLQIDVPALGMLEQQPSAAKRPSVDPKWAARLKENLPPHLFARLKTYQIEGISRILQWNGRALLGTPYLFSPGIAQRLSVYIKAQPGAAPHSALEEDDRLIFLLAIHTACSGRDGPGEDGPGAIGGVVLLPRLAAPHHLPVQPASHMGSRYVIQPVFNTYCAVAQCA
jgi:hypothetical protein